MNYLLKILIVIIALFCGCSFVHTFIYNRDLKMNPSSSALVCKRKRDPDDALKSCKRPKHDVFINYSSDEIGKSFISHLKRALDLKSFSISDHTMLPCGQDVHSEVLKAIEESEMYVVVFSPDYASSSSSSRCLDELVHIMEHNGFRKRNERKVVPVFFKVDPSHVRNQQGPFMEAFQAHQTNLDPERVQKWKQALKDAGHLSGLELQNRSEAEFISVIVEQLEKMQRPPALWVTDHHTVGLKTRAEELISTLRLDWKDGVLVVAVLGISGIGKTTIVKEAFNSIAHRFELSCFLADIHSICEAPSWKVGLPKVLISCLTRDDKFSFLDNHNDGATKIRRLVKGHKVLLVLDDISNSLQLESLGICPKWFCEGSRIIVTTREKRSLGNIPYASYHTRLLNRRESLNLFTQLMFARGEFVNTNFVEEVVACAGGLPLVLKSLKKLRILDVSYTYSLTRTGNFSGLENLEELYLQNCRSLKEVHGSIGSLKKLSILDLRDTIPIKSIPWEMIDKLPSLQKLILGVKYIEGLYPFDRCKISDIPVGVVSLPFLKHLSLHETDITTHPDSLLQLHGLNTLELYRCKSIESIPNLPGNITSIKAHCCRSLVKLPCNISELKSLTALYFESCDKLGSEDPDILMKVTGLTNLTHLTMSHCDVSKVPSEIGNLVSLKELDLSGNTFSSLPDTLSNLSQLDRLNIYSCKQLQLLPLLPSNLSEICAVDSHSLDLMSCASLRTKVCKESPFSNKLKINLLNEEGEVPEWCSNQSRGRVLSFVAPVHQDNNICGIFLCTNNLYNSDLDIVSKMHNKTKNTSHCFVSKFTITLLSRNKYYMRVMCYPLDDTTLVVEPGDHVVLEFPQKQIRSCGFRLIYESDVVDAKLTLTKPYLLPLVMAQSDTISSDSSDGDDYDSWSDDYDSCSDDYEDNSE